jgi:hypothetical protein
MTSIEFGISLLEKAMVKTEKLNFKIIKLNTLT